MPISCSSWIYTWTCGHHTHIHTHTRGGGWRGEGGDARPNHKWISIFLSPDCWWQIGPLHTDENCDRLSLSLSSALWPSYLVWPESVFFFFPCCFSINCELASGKLLKGRTSGCVPKKKHSSLQAINTEHKDGNRRSYFPFILNYSKKKAMY